MHDLRHSAATVLLRAGVDAHRVQRILRHTSVTTTTGTYAHMHAEDLREAMSAAWETENESAGEPISEPTAMVGELAGGPNPVPHVTRWLPDRHSTTQASSVDVKMGSVSRKCMARPP
ncbi:tyrosine-type recombinase/integrase [Myxococcota bacterium]